MISVLGIPFDEFSSYLRGSSEAPAKIRKAFHSDSSNYFSESCVDLKGAWVDRGDLNLPGGKAAVDAIEKETAHILNEGDKLLSLGGDHAITYPIVKSFAKRYGKLSIIHIDAHADLYHEFEGNKFSHACPFARIMEEGLASGLTQVGIRTMNTHQQKQADKFDVEVIEMKNWNNGIRLEPKGPVYLSLDMDAIDPAFAPGVSHHEPGGFTSREIISIIQNIDANVVGADLVEYNPSRDQSGITGMLAGKLFKELLSLLKK